MLTATRIERFVAAPRAQHVPVVDRLAPGLSDAEMDALVAPLDISLPVEARTWWGHHNGTRPGDGDGPMSAAIGPAWWWAPLDAVVAECQDVRGTVDPAMWLSSWLPIVIGDGDLVMETAVGPGEPAPVHVVDFEGDELTGSEHVATLPSLGALVDVWTTALTGGAVGWEPDEGYFTVDWDRADELDIPDGVL